jgi:hypothetical protein
MLDLRLWRLSAVPATLLLAAAFFLVPATTFFPFAFQPRPLLCALLLAAMPFSVLLVGVIPAGAAVLICVVVPVF